LRCSLDPAEETKEDINTKRAELRLRIKARELSAGNVRAQAAQPLKSVIVREKGKPPQT